MAAWWKVLGQPVLTPEVQKKLIDSVHAEVETNWRQSETKCCSGLSNYSTKLRKRLCLV
jgi:hypothetical protein